MLCVFFTEFNTDDSSLCRGKMYIPWYTQVLRTASDASDRCSQLCDPSSRQCTSPCQYTDWHLPAGRFPHLQYTGKIAGLNKGAVRVQISPTKLICNTHGLQKGYWKWNSKIILGAKKFLKSMHQVFLVIHSPYNFWSFHISFLYTYMYVCTYVCVYLPFSQPQTRGNNPSHKAFVKIERKNTSLQFSVQPT